MSRNEPDPEIVVKRFCRQATKIKKRSVYIGIDPGANGAIGFLCGDLYAVISIPTMKVQKGKGKKTVFVEGAIISIFRHVAKMRKLIDRPVYVAIEEGGMGFGMGNNSYVKYRMGVNFGMWHLMLKWIGCIVEDLRPHIWKRRMKVTKDKETTRRKAMNLFPQAPLLRKKDHDRAEALLIAEYHKRTRGRLNDR